MRVTLALGPIVCGDYLNYRLLATMSDCGAADTVVIGFRVMPIIAGSLVAEQPVQHDNAEAGGHG